MLVTPRPHLRDARARVHLIRIADAAVTIHPCVAVAAPLTKVPVPDDQPTLAIDVVITAFRGEVISDLSKLDTAVSYWCRLSSADPKYYRKGTYHFRLCQEDSAQGCTLCAVVARDCYPSS